MVIIESSLCMCARHCYKFFACIISFNPPQQPYERDNNCPYFIDEETNNGRANLYIQDEN